MFNPFSRLRQLHRSLGNHDKLFFIKAVATLSTGVTLKVLYDNRIVYADDKRLVVDGNGAYRYASDYCKYPRNPLQTYPYDRTQDPLKARFSMAMDIFPYGPGIQRFDVISLPKSSRDGGVTVQRRWRESDGYTFFTACDGFNSLLTVQFVLDNLVPAAQQSLLSNQYMHSFPSEQRPPPFRDETYIEGVHRTIKEVFLEVDDAIIHHGYKTIISSPSPSAASQTLATALGGSSCLFFFYEEALRQLHIALTGDMRAVLGRWVYSQQDDLWRWEVHVLTAEQTLDSPAEQARLGAALDDPAVRARLYAMDRPVSRAFGMAALKWSREMQERVHRDYLGDLPLEVSNIATEQGEMRAGAAEGDPVPQPPFPPYLTALPEVASVQIKPYDFLIVANSGLWKSLTNEETVGLVGTWILREMWKLKDTAPPAEASRESASETSIAPTEAATSIPPPEGAATDSPPQTAASLPPPDPSEFVHRFEFPIVPAASSSSSELVNPGYGSTPLRHLWRAPKDRFICTDENAAVHLARNALGGADKDLTAALMTMEPKMAEKYW